MALAIWQWKAATGGLSVSETEDRRKMMSSDRAKQAMATCSSRQAARGGGVNEPSGKCVSDWIEKDIPFLKMLS